MYFKWCVAIKVINRKGHLIYLILKTPLLLKISFLNVFFLEYHSFQSSPDWPTFPIQENEYCIVTHILITLFPELCFVHPVFTITSQVSNMSINYSRKEQQRQKRSNDLQNLDWKLQFSVCRRKKNIPMQNPVQYMIKRKTLFNFLNKNVLSLRNLNMCSTLQNYFYHKFLK